MRARFAFLADFISLLLLTAFVFLLAAYTKRFAYLGFSVLGFPLYISELTLATVLLLQVISRPWLLLSSYRSILLCLSAFLLWGFLRLGASFAGGATVEMGVTESLKQTAVFYQAVWILPALFLDSRGIRLLMGGALAGVSAAQALGWIGFLLMGYFSESSAKLYGFPVGNEVVLNIYPVAFLLWPVRWAFLSAIPFGNLWCTQIVLYLKRAWVFSIFVFSVPAVLFGKRDMRLRRLIGMAASLVLSVLLGWMSLSFVQSRSEPPYFHISEGNKAQEQRKNISLVGYAALSLIDSIYPYTDALETNISFQRIVFHGENPSGSGVTSMMAFRLHLWRQAWAGFLERPLFGQGFGTRMMETQLNGLPAMVNGKWISGPHNSYLALLNRMGIVGLLLFCALIGALLFPVLREWRCFSPLQWAVFSAIASTHFFAFFNVCLESPQGAVFYWLFLGMALRLSGAIDWKPPQAQETQK